ncbi:MAG TPA: cytochrome P450 [Kofleriaceae bacterium]|nr:cytochrome P450 [Kofleriaceae bacterium]
MTTRAAQLADAVLSPEARRDPYPLYARLRAEAPVVEHRPSGAWIVSRYDDAVAVLKDPAVFSSSVMATADRALLGADPPAHTRVRRLVSASFSPARAAALDGLARATCDQLLAPLVDDRAHDLVAELAVPLPMAVIAAVLGIEPARHGDFKRWSAAVIQSATGTSAASRRPAVRAAIAEFNAFCAGLIEDRRRAPTGDLVSILLHGGADPLTADEVTSVSRLLIIAGNETTTNLVGSCVLALLRHPAELALLRGDPSLAAAAVEESLRYDAPVQLVSRRTTTPTELAGLRIPAGATVLVVLGSANRDAARFPEPDRFDVQRRPVGHLALGAGVHYCLGAALARRTAVIALEALIAAARVWSPAHPLDDIPIIDSSQLRGPARLPLRLGG